MNQQEQVNEVLNQLHLPEAKLQRLRYTMEYEMVMGLSRFEENRQLSSLRMEPTFVVELCDGTEYGDYLALDLGGTNFRILLIHLIVNRQLVVESEVHYEIPDEVLNGETYQVFDYLATSVEQFISSKQIKKSKIPLGFTFSFPTKQLSLNSGIFMTWTKNFNCTGGIGEDVVVMFEKALAKHKNISVEVIAMLNDGTATLIAGNFIDPDCEISLLAGTGSNVCYVEKLENVDKWKQAEHEGVRQVLIDVDWGAFGDKGSLEYLKTKFDKKVDLLSKHVGSFTFEKLFSGLYMGEVVRQVVLELFEKKLIFKNYQQIPEIFSIPFQFLTKYVAMIDADETTQLLEAKEVFVSNFDMHQCETSDLFIVHSICRLISKRAAAIISAAISVYIRKIGKPKMTVAVDGSVIKHHKHLLPDIKKHIEVLNPKTQVKFTFVEDGSGRGAGIIAAVADRLRK